MSKGIMNIHFLPGQTLIDVVLALGIFFIFLSGFGMLYFSHNEALSRTLDNKDAAYLVESSFEAVQSIAAESWGDISDGTFGLEQVAAGWQFSSSSDVIGNITRAVTVSSIRRGTDCNIVESGGGVDPDMKKVSVDLSWENSGGAQNIVVDSYLARKDDPTFCIVAGDAFFLDLDVSEANIDSTKKSLVGIELENLGETSIILDKMVVTWDLPGNMTYIKIDGSNHWHSSNGTGSPQGAQPSGTEIDLVDLELLPSEDYDVDVIRFDTKVDGSTFTIKAILTDGSSKTEITSPPFVP